MRLLTKLFLLVMIVAAAVSEVLFGRPEPNHDPASVEPSTPSVTGRIKTWSFRIAAFLLVIAVGGFLFVASGIMPIKASSGHWRVTSRFLEFTKDRSVALYSRGVEVPPLEDPAHIERGAAPKTTWGG